MKIRILIATFALLATTSFAQSNAIDKYFSKYQTEDITQVHITGKMFELLAELDAEDEEMREMFNGIHEFNAIINAEATAPKSDYLQTTKTVGNEFEELISVNDKKGNATFYINESNGVVEEMLMIAHGEKEFLIVSITGNINLKAISKIMKEVQMDGYMHKTSVKNLDEFKIYPNPASVNGNLKIEIPEGLLEGNYEIFDIQGRSVASGVLNSKTNEISISGLTSGEYIVKVSKGDFDISKKILVK